jgi:hypothetical protein
MIKQFLKKISFRLIRGVHNIQLREVLCWIVSLFLPKIEIIESNNVLNILKDNSTMLSELDRDGFVNLGIALSENQVEVILERLKDIKCYDLDQKDHSLVNIDDPNKEVQMAHYKRDDLIGIPEIVQIANDSRVLNLVSEYLGVKPTISNINCWWSFGDREVAKEAQFFHRDVDDYKFLKMFFYLTDVHEENGPHIFVKGSHKVNKLLELRRFSDNEVVENFGNHIITLIEPKGSCFIEDTYGIHKGQLPLRGKRLMFQVQYSYLPLHVENYAKRESTLLRSLKLDKYINRLILK